MSALHQRLAREILLHVKNTGLASGARLTESSLQAVCGTSRAPVRAALEQLETLGIVTFARHRGFTLVGTGDALDRVAEELEFGGDEKVYMQIAGERTAGLLPDVFSETEMMRRFALSRSRLRRILDRIASEGWIERRPGNGWSFLPMIDSTRAYAESFEIRQALEPAGILSAFFVPDMAVLGRLLARQESIRDHREKAADLFEANADLHEQIALMSNNRFLVQIIAQQNRLRRLLEYKLSVDHQRAKRMCVEHIQLLGALIEDDRIGAATLMKRHIEDAKEAKLVTLGRSKSGDASTFAIVA